jgi:hypothetical protein
MDMPRYYFRLTDGKEVLKGQEGIEFPGNAAAREEALLLASNLKEGKLAPGCSWDGWFVSIVDQHGREVDRVPVAAAPEVPPPPH